MENYEQISLFDDVLLTKTITKPIRLISFFSGIEAQYKALSYLGKKLNIPVYSYKTCEWAYNSIIACNAIHNRDFTDYAANKTRDELLAYLNGNISINYNEPADLTKKSLDWLKKCYNSCIANHNLMNIMNVHGKDLEIVDTDKYEYICTYSFPCQDLSNAGLRKGMTDNNTRSGLLWEVERILTELYERERESLPQILLMENVPQVHSEKDMPDFRKWILRLEELGYTNYWEDLNAKDYGIPQNRDRCFMISILKSADGEYNYKFPKPFKRDYVLKDMLESDVDEKYYLSQKMIQYITATNDKWTGNNSEAIVNRDVGCTINTAPTSRRCDASNYICDELPDNADLRNCHQVADLNYYNHEQSNRVYGDDACSPTIRTGHDEAKAIKILDTNNKALNETLLNNDVNDGDFIDAYNKSVKSDVAGCITTRVSESNNTFVAEKPLVIGGIGDKKSNSGTQWYEQNRIYDDKLATSIPASSAFHPYYATNLRIRKLTPKECMRLMAFKDADTDNMYAAGLTDSAIYHCAGDSICVNVLIGIFAKLFNCDAEQLIKSYFK